MASRRGPPQIGLRRTVGGHWTGQTVINTIQVGGYRPATVVVSRSPKYGLRQTIGDTLGIRASCRPAHHSSVAGHHPGLEELCPQALFITTQPHGHVCWALNKATSIKTVGLCHSVQGHGCLSGALLGMAYEDLHVCAGSTTPAYYLRFESHGEDLYPRLHRLVETSAGGRPGALRDDASAGLLRYQSASTSPVRALLHPLETTWT